MNDLFLELMAKLLYFEGSQQKSTFKKSKKARSYSSISVRNYGRTLPNESLHKLPDDATKIYDVNRTEFEGPYTQYMKGVVPVYQTDPSRGDFSRRQFDDELLRTLSEVDPLVDCVLGYLILNIAIQLLPTT